MEAQLHIVAQSTTAPENADDYGHVLQRLAEATRTEPGCVFFDVFRSLEQPGHFVTLEGYADGAALTAHQAADHFQQIVLEELVPLMISGDARVYGTPIDVPASD